MMLTPRRYSTRPEVVTALQFDGTNDNAQAIIEAFSLPVARFTDRRNGGELAFTVGGFRYTLGPGAYILQRPSGALSVLTADSFHEHYGRPLRPDAEQIVARAVAAATDSFGYVKASDNGPAILATTLRRVLLDALEHEGE